ncbi:MAG TPA: hypothetical protein VML96_05660, partial [Egibacteraceae bacterium]|nr:hypothetical protein [Egibacteraceae bacterium]
MTGIQRKAHRATGSAAERGFGVRLVLTLIVTLSAIGAAQYFLTGPRLIETALAREIDGYRSDATLLEQIYASNHLEDWAGEALPVNVHREVVHMGQRSNVRLARLVSASGAVLGAGLSDALDRTHTDQDGTIH